MGQGACAGTKHTSRRLSRTLRCCPATEGLHEEKGLLYPEGVRDDTLSQDGIWTFRMVERKGLLGEKCSNKRISKKKKN